MAKICFLLSAFYYQYNNVNHYTYQCLLWILQFIIDIHQLLIFEFLYFHHELSNNHSTIYSDFVYLDLGMQETPKTLYFLGLARPGELGFTTFWSVAKYEVRRFTNRNRHKELLAHKVKTHYLFGKYIKVLIIQYIKEIIWKSDWNMHTPPANQDDGSIMAAFYHDF